MTWWRWSSYNIRRNYKTETIKEFYFSYNNITIIGAIAIAHSLPHNTSLEVLYWDISYNAIDQDGAMIIAQAIVKNKTLKQLYMLENAKSQLVELQKLWTEYYTTPHWRYWTWVTTLQIKIVPQYFLNLFLLTRLWRNSTSVCVQLHSQKLWVCCINTSLQVSDLS